MHNHKHRIAQFAIRAGLGLSLVAGTTLMPMSAALGREETTAPSAASVTITQLHNTGATYDVYQLFTADITAVSEQHDQATHIDWASDDVKTAVTTFINANGYSTWLTNNGLAGDEQNKPQNVAQFVVEKIADSPTDITAATTPRTTMGLSFANELAQALAASNVSPQTATSGTAFAGTEGFYLFVTTPSTTGAGEAGTAPIWVPLGGSVTAINEKSAVPTVTKQVREDSNDTYGAVADANRSQDVDYRLTATLPVNFGAFDHYHLRFNDTLSAGLDLSLGEQELANALTVKIGNTEVEIDDTKLTASYDSTTRELVINFPDLKDSAWGTYGIPGGTTITVDYKAHLNANATVGAAGNANSVTLTYTKDPVSGGDGIINPGHEAKLFSYGIKLTKVDEQTNKALQGAKFTIAVAQDGSDSASVGKFVQSDGSLGSQAYEFTTGADGTFTVNCLDSGTYTIHETVAPAGYERIDQDLSLVVSPQLDAGQLSLTALGATLTGGDTRDVNATVQNSASGDSTTGLIDLTVTNDMQLTLPITGLSGLGSSWIVGMGVTAAAGASILLRTRRKQQC